MSLILDALNRSQRERDDRHNVPGIKTQHVVEEFSGRLNWHRVLPWLALAVALLVIGWLILPEKHLDAGELPAGERAVVTRSAASAPPGTVKPVTKPVVKPAHPAASGPVLAEQASPESVRALAPALATTTAAIQQLYKQPSELAPAAEKTVNPISAPASQETEQLIDIEKMIIQARTDIEQDELIEHAAPFLSALSQPVKDQIPTVFYSEHEYSEVASRSVVTLNRETVREGGKVAQVLTLEQILPESIILSHKGLQFRLKALNSWINL